LAPSKDERGRQPRRSPSGEGGFTLIEVLIATVILTIALVSIAELMAITLRMQMLGKNETSAVRLAQSKIDELVAVNFDPAVSTAVVIGGDLDTNAAGYFDTPTNAAGDSLGFTRRWRIAAVAGYTNVRTLTVRVVPNIADRRTTGQVELVTIIRNPAGLGL
jgi:prepilin-type N-terminal cleavage/methylation domain-containing protein